MSFLPSTLFLFPCLFSFASFAGKRMTCVSEFGSFVPRDHWYLPYEIWSAGTSTTFVRLLLASHSMGLAHGHDMLLRMCWVCTWHTIRHSLVVCCASIPANKIYILYIHLALFRNIPHNNSIHDMQQLYNLFLVGGFNPLKNICQLGLLFPIYGEIKMFQTFPNHQPDIIYIYTYTLLWNSGCKFGSMKWCDVVRFFQFTTSAEAGRYM